MTGQAPKFDEYSPSVEKRERNHRTLTVGDVRGPKAHTPPEVVIAGILNRHGVPYLTQPDTPTGLKDDDGNEIVLHPDFLIGERLALEVDGEYHRSEKMQKRDERRDAILTELGFQVVRVPNGEVEDVMKYLQVAMTLSNHARKSEEFP